MRVRPLCIACTLLVRARELENLLHLELSDTLAGFRTIAESAGVYIGPDIELPLLATVTFRKLKSIAGIDDVYAESKLSFESRVRRVIDEIEDTVMNISDELEKFRLAAKTAVAGNALDLARPYLEPYVHDIDSIKRIELRRYELDELYERIKAGEVREIAYVFDGSLELYYDAVFIKVLRQLGVSVVGVVKSESFEDDATINDVRRLGLDEYLDEVVETGSDAASLIIDEVSEEARRAVLKADAVIVKGALNYLTFINDPKLITKPCYALLRVPCRIISASLKSPIGSYVAARIS